MGYELAVLKVFTCLSSSNFILFPKSQFKCPPAITGQVSIRHED